MLRALIHHRLNVAERELGESVDYLREVVDTSLPAFFKFAKVLGMAEYRKTLPLDAWHVARMVATRHEDCGPCVRIEENLSLKDGVPDSVIAAARDGDFATLPEDLRTVAYFARSVVEARQDGDPLRDRIVERYGKPALVELSLAIAAARIFPTVKRALGHAESCTIPGASS